MIIIFQKDLFGHRRQEHHSVYSDLFTRFFCFVGILSKKQQTSFFLKSALSIAVYRWKREAERRERERETFSVKWYGARHLCRWTFLCVGPSRSLKGSLLDGRKRIGTCDSLCFHTETQRLEKSNVIPMLEWANPWPPPFFLVYHLFR